MLAFATASSEAAYPKILDALDRFGVNRKISSFVMPMGYSFNLDGSMMYCTFATLFAIACRPTTSTSRSRRRSRCCWCSCSLRREWRACRARPSW